MEDALVRGLTALGALTAIMILAGLVGVVGMVFVDWWENCRDLGYGKRLVRGNVVRPLGDYTCPCRWLNRDPTCQVHGSEEKP